MEFNKVKEHHRHYIRGIGMHMRAGRKLWHLYKIKTDYISLLIWVLELTLTRLKPNGFNQEDIVQGHILFGNLQSGRFKPDGGIIFSYKLGRKCPKDPLALI